MFRLTSAVGLRRAQSSRVPTGGIANPKLPGSKLDVSPPHLFLPELRGKGRGVGRAREAEPRTAPGRTRRLRHGGIHASGENFLPALSLSKGGLIWFPLAPPALHLNFVFKKRQPICVRSQENTVGQRKVPTIRSLQNRPRNLQIRHRRYLQIPLLPLHQPNIFPH